MKTNQIELSSRRDEPNKAAHSQGHVRTEQEKQGAHTRQQRIEPPARVVEERRGNGYMMKPVSWEKMNPVQLALANADLHLSFIHGALLEAVQ